MVKRKEISEVYKWQKKKMWWLTRYKYGVSKILG